MDVFDLQAILRLDKSDYEQGLKEAGEQGNSLGKTLSKGLGTVTKIGATAVTAAAAGAAAMTKSAVDGYKDYEQLVGGMDTLFKGSSKLMQQYADSAYATAGMSANEYMQTAVDFSAALINSLGGDTEKAANQADKAIQDMSDNANKMGTSMEGIQNAYRGFSRGNFTMLDNLSLGFAGTKEGMQELLDKAEEISGIKYDISSYSDIVDAIHVVQEEMGITGTTAEEAMKTIAGSAGSASAAWKNVLTAMAGGGDLNKAIKSLETSLFGDGRPGTGLIANIIPRVQKAMQGVAQFVAKAGPLFAKKLPALFDSILPSLLDCAISIVASLASAIPGILKSVWDAVIHALGTLFGMLRENGGEIIKSLSEGISGALGSIREKGGQIIEALTGGLLPKAGDLLKSGAGLIEKIRNGVMDAYPKVAEVAGELVGKLVSGIGTALPQLITTGYDMMTNFITGTINSIPKMIETAKQVVSNFAAGLKDYDWLAIASDIINAVVNGIFNFATNVWDAAKNVGSQLYSGLKERLGLDDTAGVGETMFALGKAAVNAVADGFDFIASNLGTALSTLGKAIMSKLKSVLGLSEDASPGLVLLGLGKAIINGIIKGLSTLGEAALGLLKGIGTTILDKIKSALGIIDDGTAGTSILDIGKVVIDGILSGLAAGVTAILNGLAFIGKTILTKIKSALGLGGDSSALETGKAVINAIGDGIKAAINAATDAAKMVGDAVMAIFNGLPENAKAAGSSIVSALISALSGVPVIGQSPAMKAFMARYEELDAQEEEPEKRAGANSAGRRAPTGTASVSRRDTVGAIDGTMTAANTALSNGLKRMNTTADTGSKNIFSSLVGSVIPFPQKTTSITDSAMKGMDGKLSAEIAPAGAKAGGIISAVKTAMDPMPSQLLSIAESAMTNISNRFNTGVSFISGIAGMITSGVQNALNPMAPNSERTGWDVINGMAGAINGGSYRIVSGAGSITNGVQNALSSMPWNSANTAQSSVNNMSGIFASGANTMHWQASNLANNTSSGMSGLPGMLNSIASNGVWNIKNQFNGGGWWSVGYNICSGIYNGISSGWSWLTSTASSLAGSIFSAAKRALGINSPSKLFADVIGRGIDEGIALGIERNVDEPINAVGSAAENILKSAKNNLDAVDVPLSLTDGGTASLSQMIDSRIVSLMQSMAASLEGMANGQIVLDTGALVGAMSPAIDTQLGGFAVQRQRGVM